MLVERLKNMKSYRESKKKSRIFVFQKTKNTLNLGGKKKRRIGMLSFPMKLVLIKSTLYEA